jgi:cephalosporin hydroxylase
MAIAEFKKEVQNNILELSKDKLLEKSTKMWFEQSLVNKYSYNFTSFSVPIIQYPQDMVALQELIWKVKPDLVIEAGIAHGGSLVQSASILAMIEYQEAVDSNTILDPTKPVRKVLGLDIDIRQHNREIIQNHFLSSRIDMIEGSSISEEIITDVYEYAKDFSNILVILDSNHTHDHVLSELKAYAPLVAVDSYCVVYDTIIEELSDTQYPDRPWGPGNSPKTALHEYLKLLKFNEVLATDGGKLNFEIDKDIEAKIQITVGPDGYLKRN